MTDALFHSISASLFGRSCNDHEASLMNIVREAVLLQVPVLPMTDHAPRTHTWHLKDPHAACFTRPL